ncbi:hypothetical protein Cgig2_017103 [Carnegiea gigantea]|uniref:Potassium transporter n=1 Tax=Carnegiea gigantea TaxID=171969 RepID=A0A9Q1JMA5_9CARY|nr:hypothetical protein Cgig2_017103 [Carnegiea gigantea]
MDLEASNPIKRESWRTVLTLAYQSLGVVYGDLSTSPLYVYKSAFAEDIQHSETNEEIYGVLSFVFWTLTLIPLFKYVFIVLRADDNGEGGTFALYSLLCRHARVSSLPNCQLEDEELSAYKKDHDFQSFDNSVTRSALKSTLEKHKVLHKVLLILALIGACMVIGDGVLTPAISVFSAVSGLELSTSKENHRYIIVPVACIILVILFALQHYGTHRVGFLFAPIVITWLLCISAIGLYNIVIWNPHVYRALSPYYMYKFLKKTQRGGWMSLGGILLCMTEKIRWPVLAIAILAAVVGSQALITGTFSIIKQCSALGCFPRVRIVHTSSKRRGQIYIPEINWILLMLCLAVTIGFRDTKHMGNASGLAVITVMLVTTCLMSLVIMLCWRRSVFLAVAFIFFFGSIEALYFSASLIKFLEGAWVPVVLSFIFMIVMYIWHYGTLKKYEYDVQNKVPINWLLDLSPNLGIVRVRGIGLIQTELVTGIPAIFSHFVTNLPAFHQVLVFLCIKSVPVPHVRSAERFLIGRIGPKEYRMYRCIARYGYRDNHKDEVEFEKDLVCSIAEFIRSEKPEPKTSQENNNADGEENLTVVGSFSSTRGIKFSEDDINKSEITEMSQLQKANSLEKPKKRVRFVVPESPEIDYQGQEELQHLMEARESGMAFILGNSYVRAKSGSSWMKKIVINYGYDFLRRNSRGPTYAISVPHASTLEVGMVYHV